MRRSWAGAGVAALCAFLIAATSVAAPSRLPPFSAGTAWVYQHTILDPAGGTQKGTMREVLGQATYRGKTYHYTEQSYTLIPRFVERDYLEWAGAHYRLIGTVANDGQGNTVEVVFDRGIDLGIQTTASGTAAVFLNGTQQATERMHYTSISKGIEQVTVPAGTFQTTRWEVTFKLGLTETVAVGHAVGLVGIRSEARFHAPGGPGNTWYLELLSGPVRP